VAGLANAVDSLAAVREIVFQRGEMTGAELVHALENDYAGADELLARIARCPRFGNDDPVADEIAAGLAEFVFNEFLSYAPWRGGKFLPSCIMFVTYAKVGGAVPATPDGRRAGSPIADSAGPHQGRDRNGPTAMLKSVTKLPHELAPGTLVVNARAHRDLVTTPQGRRRLQDLIRGYFDLGGMQIQVNVVDQETLRDAIAHPELHRDLIVRVGGYSEYFCVLSPELQLSILERTEHA
jgi:formate C-acetyltransferase